VERLKREGPFIADESFFDFEFELGAGDVSEGVAIPPDAGFFPVGDAFFVVVEIVELGCIEVNIIDGSGGEYFAKEGGMSRNDGTRQSGRFGAQGKFAFVPKVVRFGKRPDKRHDVFAFLVKNKGLRDSVSRNPDILTKAF